MMTFLLTSLVYIREEYPMPRMAMSEGYIGLSEYLIALCFLINGDIYASKFYLT